MVMEYLTTEEIQKDIKKAQDVFRDACTSSAYFLNANGMSIAGVLDILHKSLDECVVNVVELRKHEL
jgi:hypothetical protein